MKIDEMHDREVVKAEYQRQDHLKYHKRQFEEPYRSIVALLDFVKNILTDSINTPFKAIDVGCGGGANMYHLAKILNTTEWVGVDWANHFFNIGRPYMAQINVKCDFIKGDFYRLSEIFGSKSFDIAFSIQTLSWLPGYEDALLEILHVARKWVFVTSLFTEYWTDVISRVYPYDGAPWKKPPPYFYNIYSYDKFKDFCLAHGAAEFYCQDFVMDIDLPMPKNNTMGTFTRKLEGGERIQFSGPLYMPWKFIAIRMI